MELLVHLLEANMAFAILYTAYRLVHRNTASFMANRAWLLLSAAASCVLPFMAWTGADALPLITLTLPTVAVASAGSGSTLDPWELALRIHWTGAALALLMLAVRYARAWRISRMQGAEALSFFGHIQLPADVESADASALEEHERVHVRQRHSWDVLFLELLAALSWWNPLWRLALGDLRTVHELLADAAAQRMHPHYAHLLVSRALGVPVHTLVHSFRSSNLKTRLIMLNASVSPRRTRTNYLLSLPFILAAFVVAGCTNAVEDPAQPDPLNDLSKVDVQPEFPGGMEAMAPYLARAIQYPEAAAKEGVHGKVYLQLTIAKDGSVKDVTVRRGVRADLDEEAVRAVSAMPNWSPAKIKDEAVAIRFTLPVSFTLPDATGRTTP